MYNCFFFTLNLSHCRMSSPFFLQIVIWLDKEIAWTEDEDVDIAMIFCNGIVHCVL